MKISFKNTVALVGLPIKEINCQTRGDARKLADVCSLSISKKDVRPNGKAICRIYRSELLL